MRVTRLIQVFARLASFCALATVAASAALIAPGVASAHEPRHVGNYFFVVGFLDEPAYAGVKNGLDLTICDGNACAYAPDNTLTNPIQGAEKTLKVEVSMGSDAAVPLTLRARYKLPGKYAAYFMPTQAGAYTFHIHGAVNGNAIDEKFTSSPSGFNAAENVVAYPDPAVTHADVATAQDAARNATIFGVAGLLVGALGLLLAGYTLYRLRGVALAPAVAPSAEPADAPRG